MQDLPARGYRFRDLIDLRIVSSRSDLHRKQREHDFPLPAKYGNRQAVFSAAEVHRWVDERLAARVTPNPPAAAKPRLSAGTAKPKKPKLALPAKGPRGRPRKAENRATT